VLVTLERPPADDALAQALRDRVERAAHGTAPLAQ
jgi:hypothetical protein